MLQQRGHAWLSGERTVIPANMKSSLHSICVLYRSLLASSTHAGPRSARTRPQCMQTALRIPSTVCTLQTATSARYEKLANAPWNVIRI